MTLRTGWVAEVPGSEPTSVALPRVLILSHLFPAAPCPTYGIFIRRHVEALIGLGVQAHVVAPVPWAPWPLHPLTDRWSMYRRMSRVESDDPAPTSRPAAPVPPGPMQWLAGPSLAVRLVPHARRLRARFQFDLIHAHTATPDGWAAWWLAKVLDVPFVCSVRGSDINEYPSRSVIRRWATRRVVRAAGAVTAVSGALAAATGTLCGRRPGVIYNGVDRSFAPATESQRRRARQDLALAEHSAVIVFVGRCEHDKGIGELIEAFGVVAVRHPDATLVIVGEGSKLSQIRTRASGHAGPGEIRPVGTVRHEDVRSYLTAADVFVLPSYSEGMPNALLEAMACGLACAATPVGGIPEVIEHGRSGLLVPVRSVADLGDAMQHLVEDHELRTQLGAEAAATIRSRFSWERNATDYLSVYHQVVNP